MTRPAPSDAPALAQVKAACKELHLPSVGARAQTVASDAHRQGGPPIWGSWPRCSRPSARIARNAAGTDGSPTPTSLA